MSTRVPLFADGHRPYDGPSQSLFKAIREARFTDRVICPRCDGARVIRWGGFSGRQRYLCRHCRRTFSDLTATPLAYVKKPELWLEFARCMVRCETVRAAAALLGVDKDTTWRWRHRMLEAHARPIAGELSGIVEVVEQRHVVCRKGARHLPRLPRARGRSCRVRRGDAVRVIIATDRKGVAAAAVMGPRPTRRSICEFMAEHCARSGTFLGNSGPLSPVALAARSRGIEYQRVPRWGNPASQISRGHVLNAARYAHGFRRWLMRFRGVATKYLHRYLHWYWIIEPHQNRPEHLLLEVSRASSVVQKMKG